MSGKVHLLRFRAVNRDIFNAIRRGVKKVETRAATERYRSIQKADIVRFVCGKDRFEMSVVRVRRFRSIAGLLKKYSPKEINPTVKTKAELARIYYSFPGYREKIRKHGLVAIEIA